MQISAISRALINRPNLMINNDSRNSVTTPEFKNQNFQFSKVASDCLKVNVLPLSKTLAFEGALRVLCDELKSDLFTCKTTDDKGENVGSKYPVNQMVFESQSDLKHPDDAVKTTFLLPNKDDPRYVRTQIKNKGEGPISGINDFMLEMVSRKHSRKEPVISNRNDEFCQDIRVCLSPINNFGKGTPEQAYILKTKQNLMAVVEDGKAVLLTNAGKITKKDASDGTLNIEAVTENNKFKPFTPVLPVEDVQYESEPSVGEGTEIIIGMQSGRFVNEIKDSIRTFVEKVDNGEIVLKPFVANPNAKNTQLIMLAGGFGSRAEYTNASCSKIFHDKLNGTDSTKGVFRTPTGLTPMETTFVTLHNAGLLDCSKGKLSCTGDNANIKFYLNKSKVNKGNGGYALDLFNTMKNGNSKSVMIFPNDAMSRMTNAVVEANNLMESGKAAIAIVAKEIPAKDCIGTFGIMRLNDDNQIVDFAEKPKTIADEWIRNGNCLTNTFQFAVSDEVFDVLEMFEPYFPQDVKEKETRDWSKQYIPLIKTLTESRDINEIKDNLSSIFKTDVDDMPAGINSVIKASKALLGDKKVYAVPTSEPWADCGTLNAMYHTVMQIVNGDFKLEPFERANAFKCVNTQTGLVATTPELKEKIESKYDIEGQVMVVPQAKRVNPAEIKDIPVTVRFQSGEISRPNDVD